MDRIKEMFSWKKVSFSRVDVVAPGERLSWGKTVGLGLQHIVAMFGATFIVPILTGFSPSATLFFSAIATALFLLITGNRVPSYLGSSFAFISPLIVASAIGGEGVALFGVVFTGLLIAGTGVIVHFAGPKWIDIIMPPIVTGTIVCLIGFNLAPVAWAKFQDAPITALVTLVAIIAVGKLFEKNILGSLSILVGVVLGYLFSITQGEVDFSKIADAPWVGLPEFVTPVVNFSVLVMFIPVALATVVENVGHVKSVSAMTGENLDSKAGLALIADGVGTVLAGLGGGSGTTTYAENIGVMAATKVCSTAAYWVAAGGAFVLALCPKFGALVSTIPDGVLGGATALLYGMIGILGVRIWIENRIDFSKMTNVIVAGVPLVVGIANFTFQFGDTVIGGIAIGSFGCIFLYHILNIGNTDAPKRSVV